MRAGDHFAGRYRLEAALGQGGMGEVWKACDVELGRSVALKAMLAFNAGDALVQRFKREAAIGARLQHPGMTVVHDVGLHENRLFIVMELLEGEDLAHVLARSPGGLATPVALDLAVQAAEALEEAHAQKVVHRDLKPANLFLQTNGRLKICDFGIAHTADATSGLTASGQPFGTPPYMAPEQWRGERVGAACDLYALGCVLYALLTGAPPFPATEQAWALMRRHLDEIPDGVRSVRGDVPVELEDLAASLLAKDPAVRPDAATAAERMRALQRAALEVTHDATPRTPAGLGTGIPTVRGERRGPRRRHVLFGGLTALAVASGGAVLGLRLVDGGEAGGKSAGGGGADGSSGSSPADGAKSRHPSLLTSLGSYPTGPVRVAFGLQGTTLVVDGDDTADIELWDVVSHSRPVTLAKSGAVMAVSADGKTLACRQHYEGLRPWNDTDTIHVWDLASRTRTATLSSRMTGVRSLALTSDGGTLAVGGDGVVEVWDLATRAVSANFGATGNVWALAFSPDGKTLARCGGTFGGNNAGVNTTARSVSLWDVATRVDATPLSGHVGNLWAVAFSPDGKTLVSSGSDNIRLWDMSTRTAVAILKNGRQTNADAVVFSPDGKTLATGNATGAGFWDVPSRTFVEYLDGATKPLAFSPDGRTLASGSRNGKKSIQLWKLS
ncbi:WD40 repeat domain-containing serine/threonine protein kinase [Streptomyces sp. NPDC056682]|uniref:WD40 repeat domain-containing serine/threonine protein kinase n=1 Tax=Streptomyces sp. NPDC056682 TaxID=3345909 RepID=UPI00368D360C